MALASPEPGLLIADEPTTALDVTIQAQILELLKDLQRRIRVSILLITHDMGVVAENAERVVVMYAGRKVEEGEVGPVLKSPAHPYTVGLLNSLPSNPKYREARRLEAIRGTVPSLIGLLGGCPFANRCPRAEAVCRTEFPAPREVEPGHRAWCHFAQTGGGQP
jgi:oligopeptide/dipeptide ABC transporter ATP-binding protein